MSDQRSDRDALGTRWPEVGVALFLLLLAVLVIKDSLRVGIGWADDGPRSGYFPFYIGLALLGSSSAVLIGALRRWRHDGAFATREQLGGVFAVLLPMALFVGASWLLGIYVASCALIGWFMRRHGRFAWPATAAASAGVPLIVFFVFERWFLVPLPKGPLERLLGF